MLYSTSRLSHFMFLLSLWFGHKESINLLTRQIIVLYTDCVRECVREKGQRI